MTAVLIEKKVRGMALTQISANAYVSPNAKIGEDVTICAGVHIEDNVTIGDRCYIDYNALIKENVTIGSDSFIGAQCILGEFLYDFFSDYKNKVHPLQLGAHALIRSGSILYGDSQIGDYFQTGHRVTIRENTLIGVHVNLGTLSDVQGDCTIGNYVHMHSNVHIGMKTTLKDYVWIFPYVVFTNDPTPPSETLLGATAEEFAVVCTGTVVLPGVRIGKDALIGAGTTLTKDAAPETIVVGNPGKPVGPVSKVKTADGTSVYPWRYSFKRGTPWSDSDYETYIRSIEET